MCKAVEAPADLLHHHKAQRLVKVPELEKPRNTRRCVFDRLRITRSLLSATVAPAHTSDLLRLFAVATLTVMACSLVSYLLLDRLGAHLEAGALLAEDLGAFALIFLLWSLVGRLQRRGETSPSRSPRRTAESTSLEDECDGHGAGSSSGSSRRRRAQRRRCHSIRYALDQLRDVVRSVSTGASGDVAGQELPRHRTRANVAPCGLHNFHTAAHGFLLPVEVAACQYAPDVSEHLQRLLKDRWAVFATGGLPAPLASIPE